MVPRVINKRLYNLKEASEYLRIDHRTLRKLERQGLINPVKFPNCSIVRYDVFDLDKLVEIVKNEVQN